MECSKEGKLSISNHKIETSGVTVAEGQQVLQLLDQTKLSPVADGNMSYEVTNLRPGQVYQISVHCLCLNDHAFSRSVTLLQMARLSSPPVDFKGKVREKRHINLPWGKPTI